MKKTILSLALLSALTGAAFAENIVVSEGEAFEEDIVAEDVSTTLENRGSIVNEQITLKGGAFKNYGSIKSQTIDILTINSGSPIFQGEIYASESLTYRGTKQTNSYTVSLDSKVSTPWLKIIGSTNEAGLLISNSETVANVDNLWIETTSAKTGAVINGEKIKLPDNVWLKNAGSNPNARVEIYDGKSVSMKNVYSLEGKTMIQVNGESSASVENIFISSNSIMNLQTNSSEGSKYDTGVIAIDHIDLGENSSIRASVYGDAANYEKTQPYLQLIGRDVTINLSKGAFVDFGGYKEDGDHEWRPDDIFLSANSLTINIADSRSDNKIYFSGVEERLEVDRKNITLIADGSNNTGNVTDDLNQLANIAYTNTKIDLDGDGLRDNNLQCLGGINIVQEASDIFDGATATVAEGCPNCTITNVRIQDNPNVHGIAEMAALGLHIWRNEIDDMHRRVGDLRDSSAQSNGLWTRVYHGKAEYGDQNVTNRYTAFQFGYDRQVQDGFWLGGAFSYTDGDNNFDYGNGDSNLYTFSGYGSWLFGNGVYLDLVGKVGRMKNAFDIRFN